MSKPSRKKKTSAKPSPPPKGKPEQEARHDVSSVREAVESIVIAFVLAFLFRTFEAEAFVIPTGSMAHTLRGAHKDVDCPQCGYRYQASASDSAVQLTNQWNRDLQHLEAKVENAEAAFNLARPGYQKDRAADDLDTARRNWSLHRGNDVMSITCPMCRYTMTVDPSPHPSWAGDPEAQLGTEQISYNGDRILVNKFAYEFHDPERWDVIVFKFPGDAKMNYIKRLVGLPGETVLIRNGDIFTSSGGGAPKIARKPPSTVRAMMQLVHDDQYRPKSLVENDWPDRWQPQPNDRASAADAWQTTTGRSATTAEDGPNVPQTFTINGESDDTLWIRYQHAIPSWNDWQKIREGEFTATDRRNLRPQLITDFYSYNTYRLRGDTDMYELSEYGPRVSKLGLHWVGDLMLDCDVDVKSAQGELLLELVEAGKHFQATIDVATGKVTLSIDGIDDFAPTATTPLRGPGRYRVELANVDDQLLLWIDGSLVEFDGEAAYDGQLVFGDPQSIRPRSTPDDLGDLAPAAVGSRGANLRVSNLRLYRDIYYIADSEKTAVRGQLITDYDTTQEPFSGNIDANLIGFLSDPSRWSVFTDRHPAEFPLGPDQFFVLGDNSPSSMDCRLWYQRQIGHYVPREMLIGKAVFIYWPHSWGTIPFAPAWVPGWPAFGDMGLVR